MNTQPQGPQTKTMGENQGVRQKTFTPNTRKKTFQKPRPQGKQQAGKVKISFLGGIGEIGKNMTIFETENDIIVFDCGMTFADETMPGIELVIPDISYLRDKKDKIKAFVITHGHEDHIGALPFVLGEIKAPIYASRFTLALIENKMREYPRVKYKAVEVKPRQNLRIGDFSFEFIHVNRRRNGSCNHNPSRFDFAYRRL